MKIIIRAKNIKITKELQKFIESRIEGLKRFIKILQKDDSSISKGGTLAEVFVDIEKETRHHKKGKIFKAEAKMFLPHKKIVAKAEKESVEKAIVRLKDELQQEIKKYKLKNISFNIRKIRKAKRTQDTNY